MSVKQAQKMVSFVHFFWKENNLNDLKQLLASRLRKYRMKPRSAIISGTGSSFSSSFDKLDVNHIITGKEGTHYLEWEETCQSLLCRLSYIFIKAWNLGFYREISDWFIISLSVVLEIWTNMYQEYQTLFFVCICVCIEC